MPPSSTTQTRVAAARSIVRHLYALSRTVRLFGIGHPRTTVQLSASYARIFALTPADGLVVELADNGLQVSGVELDSTAAEQSFARFLRQTNRTSFTFNGSFSRETLEDLASVMAFERGAAVRRDRTPKTAGATPDTREWLRDPMRLTALIRSHIEDRSASSENSSSAHAQLSEQAYEDVAKMLQVLGRLGTAENAGIAQMAARELQRLPRPLLDLLREILAEFHDSRQPLAGDALLMNTAEQIIIRLILTKLETGNIVAAEIPSLLHRLGRQLHTLQIFLTKSAVTHKRPPVSLEVSLEDLEYALWSTAPDAAKRMVLLFDTPFYVPAECIERFIERLIAHGEESVAMTILRNYGAAVDGKDAEGRRRASKGVGELAESYALVVPEYMPKLLRSVSRQLMRESDVRMQTTLSTALVRLSYAVQQQRDFSGMSAASEALDEVVHRRPMLGMELRPRISVENRLPEYVDEALTLEHVGHDLASLLQRHAIPVTQQLCARFLTSTLREEAARIAELAARLGPEARQELVRRLRVGNAHDALSAAGLLASVSPEEAIEVLPSRASQWNRVQQDALVRQLAIAASPKRGSVLLKLLPELDSLIIPIAIDEIGMSRDLDAASDLIDIMHASEHARFSEFAKVKAIEALGRMPARTAEFALREMVQERRMLHWTHPHELRTAALQALHMIDPEQAARLVEKSGIKPEELSLGPLAIDPDNPWARQRRYMRIFPLKPMNAVAMSHGARSGLNVVELSLGGGKARREASIQASTELTLQLQVALRKVNSQVLVRSVSGNELTFEFADIGLADRSRLRNFLLTQRSGVAA